MLEKAIEDDPFLSGELEAIEDLQGQAATGRQVALVDLLRQVASDHVRRHRGRGVRRVVEAYDAGMRASNAYDFDDLLLLTYQLLVDNPKLGDIYRRLYKFVCIDEAQDMNEAQYAVIWALCGDTHAT